MPGFLPLKGTSAFLSGTTAVLLDLSFYYTVPLGPKHKDSLDLLLLYKMALYFGAEWYYEVPYVSGARTHATPGRSSNLFFIGNGTSANAERYGCVYALCKRIDEMLPKTPFSLCVPPLFCTQSTLIIANSYQGACHLCLAPYK